ncbi:MAG: formate dehydrogenase subunit gamma [Alphaproteobacteria bacterium]|nr:formate dehydrogenase subunit gamma [Alphaproteobacteria bacterium]
MTMLLALGRSAIAALALAVLASIAVPASAQQPTQVNPTASSVKEDQLFRQMTRIDGRISIPDAKEGVLIQPAGQSWRQFHEVTLPWIGAIAILGMLALLVIFYLTRGMVRIERGRSGRTIMRFNAFERFVHWLTATCFIVLAISGLNITFGRQILMPILGPNGFASWSQYAKYAHNYLSFPFTLGVVLILLMWIAWALPNRTDVEWLKQGGGLVGNKHPPAARFNAGQKIMFWLVVLGGAAAAISGYLLMFPFYATDVEGMQTAQMVHGIVAVIFVAVMLAHIYIGTIGMEGAFESMGTGDVDLNWAKQHHPIWVEQEMAQSRGASQGAPAE